MHTLDEGVLVGGQVQDGTKCLHTPNTALTCEVTLNSLLLNTPYCRAAAVFSFISCSTERSASSVALCGEGRGEGHAIHVRASDDVVTANTHSKTAFLWSWLKNGGTVRTRSLRGMSRGSGSG